jgi:hypothetical protein
LTATLPRAAESEIDISFEPVVTVWAPAPVAFTVRGPLSPPAARLPVKAVRVTALEPANVSVLFRPSAAALMVFEPVPVAIDTDPAPVVTERLPVTSLALSVFVSPSP